MQQRASSGGGPAGRPIPASASFGEPARAGSGSVGPILGILVVGLLFRLALAWVVFPGQGLAGDLGSFGSWAETLARVGPGGFYRAAPAANYPPAYMDVLWAIGVLARPVSGLLGTTTGAATLDLLKLPAILSDIAIGGLLFVAGRGWFGRKAGLAAAAAYLAIPVTWYDSAIWGQVDAVSALLMLAAILLLADGWEEPATVATVLALLVKPQAIVCVVVVAVVLVRRHLIVPLVAGRRDLAPVPVPRLGPGFARLNGSLDGLLTRTGPIRLLSSAIAGAVVLVAVILPFDLPALAPGAVRDVPVVAHVAGLLAVIGAAANQFSVLTANAYNGWALVGSTPLAQSISSGGFRDWIPDSLPVVGALSASTIGTALVGLAAALVAVGLLARDGRREILLGFTLMAFAFYALPTRVHERYLFPAFASGALLAGASLAWSGWYWAAGLLNVVNLHAVLTIAGGGSGGGFGGSRGGFGAGGLGGGFGAGGGTGSLGARGVSLPFGDLARSEPIVIAVVFGQLVLLMVLTGAWLRQIARRDPAGGRPHRWTGG